jgi:aminoglycoside phosphotransferase (APT) family kinase protein
MAGHVSAARRESDLAAVEGRSGGRGRRDRRRTARDARRPAGGGLPVLVDGHRPAGRVPPPDRLVVCHGDACSPNTLITEDGRCSGHVDLGELGVADRWADLAVATWSTEWNYGPGWEDLLLSAYGVPRDPDRTRYYCLLWDLGP